MYEKRRSLTIAPRRQHVATASHRCFSMTIFVAFHAFWTITVHKSWNCSAAFVWLISLDNMFTESSTCLGSDLRRPDCFRFTSFLCTRNRSPKDILQTKEAALWAALELLPGAWTVEKMTGWRSSTRFHGIFVMAKGAIDFTDDAG